MADYCAAAYRTNDELLLRAVRKHTKCPWTLLYIERWLKAPAMSEDGKLVARERGTPQGGVISPLLANLFLHYAFDVWIGREMPSVSFERYADDIIYHCRTEHEARALWRAIETYKLNSVDPQAYMADVLTKIVDGHLASKLDELMPWAYAKPVALKDVA
jgi:retron-type reverse transcriptase